MASTKIIAEYIWIDGVKGELRSKCKTIEIYTSMPSLDQIPIWHFDGSYGEESSDAIFLHPVKLCYNPFFRKPNILVLCECRDYLNNAIQSNFRNELYCRINTNDNIGKDWWWSIEQEYILLDMYGKPLDWYEGMQRNQSLYYCGVGANTILGRNIANKHYLYCIYAGISISSINSGPTPSLWKYNIGICKGIDIADQLWISRYILQRVCEEEGCILSFDQTPIDGWKGANMCVNISNHAMRLEGMRTEIGRTETGRTEPGRTEIGRLLHKLGDSHRNFMNLCGQPVRDFTSKVGNRNASIYIPRTTHENGYGYISDLRPGADADPYKILKFYI